MGLAGDAAKATGLGCFREAVGLNGGARMSGGGAFVGKKVTGSYLLLFPMRSPARIGTLAEEGTAEIHWLDGRCVNC